MAGFQRQTRVGDAVSYWNAFRKDNSIIIQERTVIHQRQPLRPRSRSRSNSAHLDHAADSFLCVTYRPSVQVRNHHIGHRTWRGCNHRIHATVKKVTFPSLTLGFASYRYNRFVLSRVTASSRGGLTSAHDK